jgi:hypothetical protein
MPVKYTCDSCGDILEDTKDALVMPADIAGGEEVVFCKKDECKGEYTKRYDPKRNELMTEFQKKDNEIRIEVIKSIVEDNKNLRGPGGKS